MIHLIVHFHVRKEKIQEAQTLFTKHQSDGRSDRGNLGFSVYQDVDDPTRFTSVEAWEDEDSIQAHDETQHHRDFLERLEKIQTSEKTVQKLSALPSEDRS